MARVSICLNTFTRPGVFDCLRSLANQELDGISIEIVVADNDVLESGRPFVERFKSESLVPLSYECVPQRNIAIARNNTVARASGEWLLFIDDDEIAPPNWVVTMLKCARRFEADIVLGHALATYPESTPAWLRKADPLSKRWGPTGKQLRFASTCNVLVRSDLLNPPSSAFNPLFGRTGGEDAELFHRLSRAGAKIVVCADAPVTEAIPLNRINLTYLKARFLTVGQGYAAITNRYRSSRQRGLFLISAVTRMIAFGAAYYCLQPFSRSHALRMRLRYWNNTGKIQQTLSGTHWAAY
ncbi:MAG TPA: glycosyltransferase [Devosiaceae bacterium]|nr:glycosyltransferase [Devosiaceae bacterium]